MLQIQENYFYRCQQEIPPKTQLNTETSLYELISGDVRFELCVKKIVWDDTTGEIVTTEHIKIHPLDLTVHTDLAAKITEVVPLAITAYQADIAV